MRSVFKAALLVAVAAAVGCAVRAKEPRYERGGALLDKQIEQRVSQLRYQHGQELLESISWLIYVGEPAIPPLLKTLKDEDPGTRSTVAFILGEIRDRRTIPEVQPLLQDPVGVVRYEAAAALVTMGDWAGMPVLIEGLSDTEKRNRYKVYDVLHRSTGLDFGYDPLGAEAERERAVEKWRSWWQLRQKQPAG